MEMKSTMLSKAVLAGFLASTFVFCSTASAKPKAVHTPQKAEKVSEQSNRGPQYAALRSKKQAVPAQSGVQAPGYFRMHIGQVEMTSLFDGAFDFNPALLKDMDTAQIKRILSHHHGKTPMKNPRMAYLVNTGKNLVLVNTGTGKLFGDANRGLLLDNLKAAGYTPEQVDTVILTHLHGDHTGGLVDGAKRVFPNATVYASQKDADFWLSEKAAAAAAENHRGYFKLAVQSTQPYLDGHWKTVKPGTEIVPGIRSAAAYGHTPGHMVLEVASGGQKLMLWGDIVHNYAIQFAHPEVTIDYDIDTNAAKKTRLAIIKQVADSDEWVAGMHLPFLGIGRIVSEKNGGYRWIPVEYGPLGK